MRVLVTGREGQVVRSLLDRAADSPDLELTAVGRPELDLEQPGSATEIVRRVAPDVVISAAAYTAVDQAEDEPERAMRVNGEAPGELAAAARELGAAIIHLSTDYVFDGAQPEPYREDHAVGPIGVYGRSKLLGEERVRAANPRHLILRTAWVYSPYGKNFVRTMLTVGANRDQLSVVADQQGNPTSALDIADALIAVLRTWAIDPARGLGATFHLAGSGRATWAEFAEAIFQEAAARGSPAPAIVPIRTADWPTKAVRPANSQLDSSAFAQCFGHSMPHWRESLATTVDRLLAA